LGIRAHARRGSQAFVVGTCWPASQLAAAARAVVGGGVGLLQAEGLVELADEGVEGGVGAGVEALRWVDGEGRVGDAQAAGPGGAAAEAERQHRRRRGPRDRRRRRRRLVVSAGSGGGLVVGVHLLERARHLREVEPVAPGPGGAAAAAADLEGEQRTCRGQVTGGAVAEGVGRRGGAAELDVPGVVRADEREAARGGGGGGGERGG